MTGHRIVRRFIAAGQAGAALLMLSVSPVAAQPADGDFAAWLGGVREEALSKGIRRETLDAALKDLKPLRRIVERDRNQSEFILTYKTYRDRVVTRKNIAVGRKKARLHAELLDRVSKKYGVQPRFILAIWGIETRFGAVKTSIPVIASVATLAFDKRRSRYFRAQLMAALTMLDRGHIDLQTMTGSWAGAMGQPQFMPESYLNFAEDFDGDGKRDIWNSTADVFASIANYLARNGGRWHDDQTWGRPVRLPAGFAGTLAEIGNDTGRGCRAIKRMSRTLVLPEWQKLGVRRIDGRNLPTRPLAASIVQPDGAGGLSFLVYNNYRSILSYNCAHHYALTVSVLADRIAGR